MNFSKILLTALFLNISYTFTARILGIFPMFSHSHYQIGHRFMKALAERGHNVTFVCPFKDKSSVENLEEIVLTDLEEPIKEIERRFKVYEIINKSIYSKTIGFYKMGLKVVKLTLDHKSVQAMLKSNKTFDLIITEPFVIDALRGFSYKYNAPLILVSTVGSSSITNYLVGNPEPLSSVPELNFNHAGPMEFRHRLQNIFDNICHKLVWYFFAEPNHNKLIQKYFPGAPSLNQLKTALIFLNSHPAFTQAVPHVPNMIEIGGFHISDPVLLQESLQQYLDYSEQGAIYFSLGSLVKSQNMSNDNKRIFQNVFRKLNVNVIWKYEGDDLIESPENVLISKWIPQQAVLAHPNVKIFITHGGLLSTIEALYNGKPIIGIPIFGDQPKNIQQIVLAGFGLCVPYHELSEERLYSTIKEMLTNKSYENAAHKRSEIFRDYPIKPLDNAMYWTEYVLKYGTDHLQFNYQHLNWIQANLVDVMLLFVICIILSIFIVIKLHKFIILFIKRFHVPASKKSN